jgi:hypothetical protein
LRKTE